MIAILQVLKKKALNLVVWRVRAATKLRRCHLLASALTDIFGSMTMGSESFRFLEYLALRRLKACPARACTTSGIDGGASLHQECSGGALFWQGASFLHWAEATKDEQRNVFCSLPNIGKIEGDSACHIRP